MKLCILVTTMHQKEFSKFYEMNLKCDAVIANQCDKNEIHEEVINGCRVKLVSTDSRGISKNRNDALEHCFGDCDYVMFSDDDLVYDDDYVQKISNAFAEHPEADAIKFNIRYLSQQDGRCNHAEIGNWEKATRRNMSACGVCGLVIRKEHLISNSVFFDENFGPGTKNYCGEDTIFIQELINKGIRLYRSPVTIAGIDQSESTWYEGYTERYYETVGMVFQRMYPGLAPLLAMRSSYKHYQKHESDLSFTQILSSYMSGIKRFKNGDY